MPAPRRVRRRPFVQWQAPLVWTTLSLTIHADGKVEGAMTGHSRFPRHWVYDDGGRLTHKSGLADFKDWYRKSFGRHTPWGDTDSKALVTAVETALERTLSAQIMQGGVEAGHPAGEGRDHAGQAGRDRLGGLPAARRVLRVRRTAAAGRVRPGRAARRARAPGGRRRTSTLVAVTPCRVAAVEAAELDRGALQELSKDHRRTRPDRS